MGNNQLSIKQYMAAPEVQKRIKEMLDDRASEFTTSIISLAGQDPKVMECEPRSLFNACLTAASMRLPISKELAMAHIIPYKNTKLGVTEAQIQLGWRAYVQMAQRSGEYKTIAASEVYEGQLISSDPLRGNVYDFRPEAKKSDKILGYASLFILRNGFEKDLFMTVEDLTKHGKRYSQAFKSNYGPWTDNFDAMAKKTVLKLLIKNFGPMSIDMQKAVDADQAIVRDEGKFDYIDGEVVDDGVKASDDEKNAILAANGVEVDPSEATDEDLSKAMDEADGQQSLTEKAKARYAKK